ncbi:MAG TPA: hypothetical protein VEJ46_11980 [Candidatus Acidoferrum sp.]|nr:hypothetical protein [Candidatus Acidoferrum sp.]
MTTDTYSSSARAGSKEATYAALAAEHVAPCISIYLTSGVGADVAKQQLPRVKSLLRAAEADLRNSAMSLEEAEAFLTSNWRAVEEGQPPHPIAEALAVFISKDFFGFSHLPAPVIDRVMVGEEFFVRPLLSCLPHEDRFFVLTLSQKHVKLLEGSRRGLRERTLWDTPESLREDFEGYSFGFERQYQMHTASSPESLQKGAVFHGRSLRHKDRIAHFLHDVNQGVVTALKDQPGPLIVAALDYLVPIYREVNTHTQLLQETIGGNPDLLSPNAIYTAAWNIVGKELSKTTEHAFAVYTQHMNSPLTSSNLRETVAAAHRGLVRFLFVPATGERWGSLVPPETVHVHSVQEPGDSDLLNLAAILTLRHGGQVYALPPGNLSEGADMAAVFRYALGSQAAGVA